MTREELIKSPEYWILEIQMALYDKITDFMKTENFNRKQLADKFGFTKGYVSQILNGEYDHRISKMVELALSVGKVPVVKFIDIEDILKLDKLDRLNEIKDNKINIEPNNDKKNGASSSKSKSVKPDKKLA